MSVDGAPVRGASEARVTLVEFTDGHQDYEATPEQLQRYADQAGLNIMKFECCVSFRVLSVLRGQLLFLG